MNLTEDVNWLRGFYNSSSFAIYRLWLNFYTENLPDNLLWTKLFSHSGIERSEMYNKLAAKSQLIISSTNQGYKNGLA
jgi:hypothetical protein